jgi:hypothetical protein
MNSDGPFSMTEAARAGAVDVGLVREWALRLPGGPRHTVTDDDPTLTEVAAAAAACAAFLRSRGIRKQHAEEAIRLVLRGSDAPTGVVVHQPRSGTRLVPGPFRRDMSARATAMSIPVVFDLDDFVSTLCGTPTTPEAAR